MDSHLRSDNQRNSSRSARIDIVYFRAGSGHVTSARAIECALKQTQSDWDVRTVDLTESLQAAPWFQWPLRCGINLFNIGTRRSSLPYYPAQARISAASDRWFSWSAIPALTSFWRDRKPTVVVSVIPLFQKLIFRAATRANPNVRNFLVPVDWTDMFPGYWLRPRVRQTVLAASDELIQSGLSAGLSTETLIRISGMPVHPDFYLPPKLNRVSFFRKWGFRQDLPLMLMHFGGQGSTQAETVVRTAIEQKLACNLLVLCGQLRSTRDAISRMETPYPTVALVADGTPIHDYLTHADVVVGRPGTLTIAECEVMGKPIVLLPAPGLWELQKGGAERVLANQMGLVVFTAAEVPSAVKQILQNSMFRERARMAHHRGVFDIVEKISQAIEPSAARIHRKAA